MLLPLEASDTSDGHLFIIRICSIAFVTQLEMTSSQFSSYIRRKGCICKREKEGREEGYWEGSKRRKHKKAEINFTMSVSTPGLALGDFNKLEKRQDRMHWLTSVTLILQKRSCMKLPEMLLRTTVTWSWWTLRRICLEEVKALSAHASKDIAH